MGLLDQDVTGLTTRRVIVEGIVPTLKTVHPGKLECVPYVPWAPNLPCAAVVQEILDPTKIQTMDRRMVADEKFRVWIITGAQDAGPEACLSVYDYCDNNGPLSIPRAFAAADAPWRSVPGISDLKVEGFARMPLDIQGPGWLDWFGAIVWAHALLISAHYGK